ADPHGGTSEGGESVHRAAFAQLVIPPSAIITAPVTKLDMSDARNSATLAISSGLPCRLSGICELNSSVALTPVILVMAFSMLVWNSLSIGPGLSELTRIRRGAAA